ncbi:1843_t:CDS:2, partial [Entrophospora sp. SA101]
ERLDAIKKVPNFLVPKYFALLVKTAYTAAVKESLKQLSPFVFEGGPFIRSLALVSVQMYGTVLSTGLHPTEIGPSVAAGLPHFTFQHMRCWGRDVFISLRGLFITTGNFEAARRHIIGFGSVLKHGLIPNLLDSGRRPRDNCLYSRRHIIGFGSVLKHGLIPNLLDSGRRPRYNCRDASWWYLQAVQDYCNFAPEGLKFLSTPVARRFPKTDEFVEYFNPLAYSYSSTILEIIHEILERHARGIHFREWNAGPNLDHAMTSKGFDIDIEVDWSTGFLFGGNQWNCGTWMDKMGDSERAGNKGIPATPRDGAAVEIIGLLKSTLRWVIGLIEKGVYPWKGVEVKVNGATKLITFFEWNDLIQNSFEKYFYVPLDLKDDSKYALNTKLVNRRGIYKDIYRSTKEYEDYQLRPNFPIAMVVAPELFEEEHAMQALIITREILAGPLGMRTLDPKDWAYRGNYDNNNDGDDKSIAKGWNYHQGPEWLWCTGYFLRAYLYFDTRVGIGKNNVAWTIADLPHRRWRLKYLPDEFRAEDVRDENHPYFTLLKIFDQLRDLAYTTEDVPMLSIIEHKLKIVGKIIDNLIDLPGPYIKGVIDFTALSAYVHTINDLWSKKNQLMLTPVWRSHITSEKFSEYLNTEVYESFLLPTLYHISLILDWWLGDPQFEFWIGIIDLNFDQFETQLEAYVHFCKNQL